MSLLTCKGEMEVGKIIFWTLFDKCCSFVVSQAFDRFLVPSFQFVMHHAMELYGQLTEVENEEIDVEQAAVPQLLLV